MNAPLASSEAEPFKWFLFEWRNPATPAKAGRTTPGAKCSEWYYGSGDNPQAEALDAWKEDLHRYGIKPEDVSLSMREATPEDETL